MQKNTLIADLVTRHQTFGEYIDGLSESAFEFHREGKWTPGQELEHILTSIRPLVNVLPNKEFIASKFGKGDGQSGNYDSVVSRYQAKLAEGGAAFGQYLPEPVTWDRKAMMLGELNECTEQLKQILQDYSEAELDGLRLPHPLVGLFTIREMIYFTSYHVGHHQKNTINNLAWLDKVS
ncbi:MAG: DinB family protein [Bacteroidota bacterium]